MFEKLFIFSILFIAAVIALLKIKKFIQEAKEGRVSCSSCKGGCSTRRH